MSAKRLIRCTSGAAVLEAAVTLPLAIALMVGGVEFGRAIFNYHSVDKSLRNATRYLARVPSGAVMTWGRDQARQLALRGTTDTTCTTSCPPLLASWDDPTTIAVNFDPTVTYPTVRLTATVPFTFAMLPAIGYGNTVTIVVSHEECLIEE